ncbi:MAG: magnesium/cobalt transporter CorA [Candidatus Omnitrophota bacterium]
MPKPIKRKSKKARLVPGISVYPEDRKTGGIRITVIDYDENQFQEKEIKTVEECFPFKDRPTVTWVNIDGIHNPGILEKIGAHFNIHPLVLEDIATIEQRPKMEDYQDYIFVVFKMLYYDEKENEIRVEQVSVILGANFVISFQEKEGDVFNPIRERIRNAKGRIRKMGADYLAYSLLDAVVDNYFLVMERLGEKVEGIEEELVNSPAPQTLQIIQGLKRDMIFLRKSVWPLRELISGLQRAESELIQKSTQIFLRDVYDHTIQVIDTVESLRDMVSGMLDIYLSSISNKMNEVMKVLTIIATIFMPLTFIAGIYGMNFRFMPELQWPWGYFMVLLIMIAVTISMIVYFKRKRWF